METFDTSLKSKNQRQDFFYKMFILITNYFLPEQISLLALLQFEIKGGGGKTPISFGKRPRLLSVKILHKPYDYDIKIVLQKFTYYLI